MAYKRTESKEDIKERVRARGKKFVSYMDAAEEDSEGGASDSASEEPKTRVSTRKRPLDSHEKEGESSRSVGVYTSRGVETTLQEVSKSTLQEVSITTPQEVPKSAPQKSKNNINNTYCIENESNHIQSPVSEHKKS